MRRDPAGLILVPAKHAAEVDRRISAIREKDEPKRLEYDCEKLKEALIEEFGVAVTKSSLVDGRRYGVLGYSPMATAIRGNRAVPYHGEIYLYLWTYCGDGVFRTENGWGIISESRLPGCPLIELG